MHATTSPQRRTRDHAPRNHDLLDTLTVTALMQWYSGDVAVRGPRVVDLGG